MKRRPDTVENARYIEYPFHSRVAPILLVTLDGRDVAIDQEQKMMMRWGVVALNSLPEEGIDDVYYRRYYAVLPAEEGGRGQEIVYGATADRRVVALTRRFWRDMDTGEFRPGKRLEIPWT